MRPPLRNRQCMENPLARIFTVRALLRFAFPTIVMMLFMGLYTVADTVFVSRFVNTDALSALNIVCPVINVTVGLGTMLATGGSAVVAGKLGAGNEKGACRDFTLIILSGVCLGLLIAALGIAFLDGLIRGLGASGILFPYCKEYLFILLLLTPASILQVLFQMFIVTAGRPGLGMLLSAGAGTANVLLDYLFMGPLDMGIAGSALGTGIGYMIPAAAGLVYFARSGGPLRFRRPGAHLTVLVKSCSNGVSELVGQIATAATTFLFNAVMLRLLGEDGVAAVTILIYTQFLLAALYIGFSMGVAPILSFHYGRGDAKRLKSILRMCLVFIGIVSVLVFLAAMLLGAPLAGVFSPKGTAVYRIARRGFLIFPFSFLFCGFNIFASAAFTALADGKRSAAISFLRTFGLITTALLLLPRFLGVTGVWLAVPLAELLTALVSARFLSRFRGRSHPD